MDLNENEDKELEKYQAQELEKMQKKYEKENGKSDDSKTKKEVPPPPEKKRRGRRPKDRDEGGRTAGSGDSQIVHVKLPSIVYKRLRLYMAATGKTTLNAAVTDCLSEGLNQWYPKSKKLIDELLNWNENGNNKNTENK